MNTRSVRTLRQGPGQPSAETRWTVALITVLLLLGFAAAAGLSHESDPIVQTVSSNVSAR
jgi:hypothetical protein